MWSELAELTASTKQAFLQKKQEKKKRKDLSSKEEKEETTTNTKTTTMPWPKFSLDPQSESEPVVFERGDHVYQWCSVGGVPYVFQHHGIVMHVEFVDADPDGPMTQNITIADFSNFLPESSNSSNSNQQSSSSSEKKNKYQGSLSNSVGSLIGGGEVTGGILRVYTTSSKEDCLWHKVEYGVPLWKTAVKRSGSCTTLEAHDPPETVLNRVNFLLRHQSTSREHNDTFRSALLPDYNVLYCNCECIAMWCKTGRFGTLQGASLLASATWGYTASGTMALRQAVVAEEMVSTSSMLGFLGTAGRAASGLGGGTTTTAATAAAPTTSMAFTASSAQPWVLGAITAYGAVTVGTLLIAKAKWKATTEELNEALEEETIRANRAIS